MNSDGVCLLPALNHLASPFPYQFPLRFVGFNHAVWHSPLVRLDIQIAGCPAGFSVPPLPFPVCLLFGGFQVQGLFVYLSSPCFYLVSTVLFSPDKPPNVAVLYYGLLTIYHICMHGTSCTSLFPLLECGKNCMDNNHEFTPLENYRTLVLYEAIKTHHLQLLFYWDSKESESGN